MVTNTTELIRNLRLNEYRNRRFNENYGKNKRELKCSWKLSENQETFHTLIIVRQCGVRFFLSSSLHNKVAFDFDAI